MDWFLRSLRHYADFRGRAGRPEYWYTILFFVLLTIVLGIVDTLLGTAPRDEDHQRLSTGLLGALFTLAMVVPMFAVAARRLHDIGRSGWWQLVGFVPFVGALVLLYWFVQPSQAGPNAYGQTPTEPAG